MPARSHTKQSKNSAATRGGSNRKGAQPRTASKQREIDSVTRRRQKEEIKAIVFLAVGIFLIFSLFVHATGVLGDAISYGLKGSLGAMAYAFPIVLIIYAIAIFVNKGYSVSLRAMIYTSMIFVMLMLFISAFWLVSKGDPLAGGTPQSIFAASADGKSGGVVGMYLGAFVAGMIGKTGLYIISTVAIVISALLLARTTISDSWDVFSDMRARKREAREARAESRRRLEEVEIATKESILEKMNESDEPGEIRRAGRAMPISNSGERIASSMGSAEIAGRGHPVAMDIGRGARGSAGRGNIGDFDAPPITGGDSSAVKYDADGNRGGGSFFRGLFSGAQKNIIDAVKNNERHVPNRTGLDEYDDVYSQSYGTEHGFEGVNAEGSGYGLEPPSYAAPGRGLDGYDEDSNIQGISESDFARDRVNNESIDSGESDCSPGVAKATKTGKTHGSSGAGSATSSGKNGAHGVSSDTDLPPWEVDESVRKPVPSLGLNEGEGFSKKGKNKPYKLPPLDLLKKSGKSAKGESEKELNTKARKLEEVLRDFRVDAKVLNVTVGPTVTRYEVEPDVGVKINSIRSLEPDLALRLEVKSVRVVAMPAQAVVGIEAYNEKRNIVTLRDMIDSQEFREKDSKVAFVLGKNISGERIIASLADMPHLLIAGTTGSGKSVCINSILLSIMYKATPDEVKLILVDPKVVELKPYSDIPHLLLPVVTSPEKAATALGYAVTIMNERYAKFAEYNVRNLEGFNEMMIAEGKTEEVLPQIVVVIDELSDLMMIAPQKVQESISRLAAMARAAGMHLIVATQQPLASILTSVIKANIPSRIAFSVSSNSASRVILDEPGAERLHGKGDMLFSPVGTREPVRIQGSFVSEAEVYKVTEYVKKEMDPEYSPDILDSVNEGVVGALTEDEDELFRDSVEAVVTAKQASVSMLQRRFRIGYNRAARLVDMMEERGMVAPSDGTNKPRKVLMTESQFESYISGGGSQADAGAIGVPSVPSDSPQIPATGEMSPGVDALDEDSSLSEGIRSFDSPDLSEGSGAPVSDEE